MSLAFTIEAAVLGILLVCSFFFSCSETALFALNPIQLHRLRKSRPSDSERIERLLATPTRLLSTILVGNTLVNVAASGLGFIVGLQLLRPVGRESLAEPVSITVMTLLLVLFGEVTPKRLAMRYPERLAPLLAPFLSFLIWLLTPFRVVVENVAGLFQRDLRAPNRSLTEAEFLTAVEVGEEEGVVGEEVMTMIDGIIRLGEIQVSQVMTPRVDLVSIDLDDSPEERHRIASNVQFRYLPVYRDTIDRPDGFLDVPAYLLSPNRDFEGAIVNPIFVPETTPLDSLLATFQKERRRIAFVSDEFGGTAGIVTMGDIVEEIIADVENEYGVEKLTIQKMGENCWIVDGSTNLDDVNGELGTQLQADGVSRISGWISAQTRRVPHPGEIVDAQGCRVTVHRTRKNRVVTVFIEKVARPVETAGEFDL